MFLWLSPYWQYLAVEEEDLKNYTLLPNLDISYLVDLVFWGFFTLKVKNFYMLLTLG